MCCPRNDRPDTQALSVNVLMKWQSKGDQLAHEISSEQFTPVRLNVCVVKPVHFILSSSKCCVLIRVSEQHLEVF